MREAPARAFELLRNPSGASSLSPDEWSAVLGIARHGKLLPRLSLLIGDSFGGIPARVQDHLLAARRVAEHSERSMRWEVDRIETALRSLDVPIVLLKGAAYVVSGLPAGIGRLASDVDILVPRDRIGAVESALMDAGWNAVKLDPYDQRFYRQHSHELPPLQHTRRGTVVDVHHNILPVSGRIQVDAALLLQAAARIEGHDRGAGLWTLGPEDMVLHNAAHLFQDGELAGSVRDLVDADALCGDFGARVPGFWTRLPARARQLGLERPLFYVLRYARRFLGSPIPAEVDSALTPPPALVLATMDRLVGRALLPIVGEHNSGDRSARFLLYIRSHWLRMPPAQLAMHLSRKALRRWSTDPDEE